jgi:nitrate reductase gamma subunit
MEAEAQAQSDDNTTTLAGALGAAAGVAGLAGLAFVLARRCK